MGNDGSGADDDGRITCDDKGLVIRWYYPWGAKRVAYSCSGMSSLFP